MALRQEADMDADDLALLAEKFVFAAVMLAIGFCVGFVAGNLNLLPQ